MTLINMKQKSPEELAIDEEREVKTSRKISLVLSFISFVGAMFFWSNNITGNAVGGFSGGGANLLGGILFILAIIGFFDFSKNRYS